MKFYNDFNAMYNAQSGVRSDMSVFNGVHEIFDDVFGPDFGFINDYPDLCLGLHKSRYNTDTEKYFHVDLTDQLDEKMDRIFTAFYDRGRFDDFVKLFPKFVNGGGQDRLGFEPLGMSVYFGDNTDGTFLFSFGFGSPDKYNNLEQYARAIKFTIPNEMSQDKKDKLVAEKMQRSGVIEQFKACLDVFQKEADRIKNFDIAAYFGDKQYDLTKPWKEKFMMPVD